ncbi:hypothetical protein R1flu_024643 [Riccia fluitans]|uniref:Uncharacterized protein n=1 Tax=Riccia fluitans TaxID=41844 RepID=A0ABD1XVH2_9MARC
MAPCRSKNLKTKEVKIPHPTISNCKKMETWGVGGLFAIDWSGTYDNLVEELVTMPKAAGPKFEYRGKPEEWTSEVWKEVYNLPKASPGGYIMRGKIQFTELQLLKILNAIFTLVRPEHFQHNLLAFYHHAWAAITNSDAPTPDWGEVVKKTVARQIKSLGVCNEATCLGPYLAHLYTHFHEMDQQEKEASKKRKASIQTVSDSDTETEPEEEKEPSKEVPRVFCESEASGSKPLDLKVDFAEWGNRVESFSHETGKLFEAFHVEFGSVTTEAVARNLKEMFTLPPVVEMDLQPWKEMVRTLADFSRRSGRRLSWLLSSEIISRGRIGVQRRSPR